MAAAITSHHVLNEIKRIAWEFREPVALVAIFVLLVQLIKKVMRNRAEVHLKPILFCHNIALMLWSLYVCVDQFLVIYRDGLCGPSDQTLWLFYYSRYYEMLDTMFLALRKRPIIFLHFYHHCSVPIMALVQLLYMPMGWRVVAVMNGAIHTAMYSYYALRTVGMEAPWGRFITLAQILQHFGGIVLCFYWYYPCAGARSQDWGPWLALIISLVIVSSYLYLFTMLYFNKWEKPTHSPAATTTNSKERKKTH